MFFSISVSRHHYRSNWSSYTPSHIGSSLATNIHKLFSEQIEIFSSVQFNKASILTGIIKISLKVSKKDCYIITMRDIFLADDVPRNNRSGAAENGRNDKITPPLSTLSSHLILRFVPLSLATQYATYFYCRSWQDSKRIFIFEFIFKLITFSNLSILDFNFVNVYFIFICFCKNKTYKKRVYSNKYSLL